MNYEYEYVRMLVHSTVWRIEKETEILLSCLDLPWMYIGGGGVCVYSDE